MCVAAWVQEATIKNWQKKKKKMQAELETVQDLVKAAQLVFNKFIRLRDKDELCISCGKKINGVKHASHYLSAGGHSAVRYNEDNVWVSCYKCNVMLSGNQIEYRKRLIQKIGVERVEWLENNGNIVKKWTKEELKLLITEYKKKTKQLEK
jgi:5-methylcytosine-specific restriction endonuclease McrA